jgi:hypothetical protein
VRCSNTGGTDQSAERKPAAIAKNVGVGIRLAYEAQKSNSNREHSLLAPRIPSAVGFSREDAWTQHAGCRALTIRSIKKHFNDKRCLLLGSHVKQTSLLHSLTTKDGLHKPSDKKAIVCR